MFIPLYYFFAYRQLFGYGVWGTHSTWEFISMFGAFLLLGDGVLLLGYWISKKTAKKEKAAQYNKPL